MSVIRNNKLVYQAGFSLIELAVVLVIIGVLIGSFIGTLSSRIDNTRRSETVDALEEIKTALYGFAISQVPVRLPCPDTDNDGLENVNAGPGTCVAANFPANLPWLTLGVERGDAWSSTYSYWASDTYANLAGFNLASNGLGQGQIDDNTTPPPAINTLSVNVAAVIMSHGKNQFGSIGVDNSARPAVPAGAAYNDERENQDVDAVIPVRFIDRDVTDVGATVIFDDILIWISEYELKGKMVQAGALP